MTARSRIVLALIAGAMTTAPGWSDEPTGAGPRAIDLSISIAEIMRLDDAPATIVIGNPAIADATIADERTMILTGRAAGVTNLIVMDAEGGEIANIELRVSATGPRHVVVQDAARRTVFVCAPGCEPVAAASLPAAAPMPPVPARPPVIDAEDMPEDEEAPMEEPPNEEPAIEEVDP